MKNTRVLLFTLIASFGFAFTAQAQFSLGFRGGSQWSNVAKTEVLDKVTPEFEALTASFQGALVGEYAFGKVFALQSELGLTRKGFGYRQATDINLFQIPLPVGVLAEARFNYLDLPVMAKLKFGGAQFKGYVMAGPQLGYALNGKLVTRADGLFDFQISKTNIDLEAINYERLEFAGVAGAGVAYETSFGTFFADARYQHGFTELYDIPLVDEHIRNRGLALSAGFMLPIGGRSVRP